MKSFKKIYFIILGMIIFGVLTVSAAIMLQPDEVSFTSDKTSQNTVKGALDELYDISRGECPVGHVCTTCGVGTYANQTTMECVTCPTGYTSDAGTGKESDCYIETTAGKYIANAGDSTQTNCPSGSYCPSTIIKYGNTGGATICPTGYTSAAGATAENKCYIQTTAGKYIRTSKTSTQTTCPAGSYCPSAKIYYGNTGNIQSCGNDYTSSAGSSSSSDCTKKPYTYTKDNGKGVVATYYCNNGTASMRSCSYNGTECDGGNARANRLIVCTTTNYLSLWGYCNTSLAGSGSVYGPGFPQTESCS